MSFLAQLWKTWTGCFRKRSSSLTSLNPTDPLTRYILSKSHFSAEKGRVKPPAFMPWPSFKLSVFQIRDLAENRIWEMGESSVAKPTNRTLYGRGDITLSAVHKNGLRVDPDNNPTRHADIVGWPEEKSEQKLLAMELAEDASLRLKSS